ncbi:MAG: dihydrofolate reductase [Hyphomicrobiaceae bacterium]
MKNAPSIALIVAAAENGVIGRDGAMPWHLSQDLKCFRRLTMGKPVIMGRKTFQSIGKPLDGRTNIVVSRNSSPIHQNVTMCASLADAIAVARQTAVGVGVDEIMVIGGSQIYRAALPLADRIYMTRVHSAPDGDTWFADPDPGIWYERSRERLPKACGDEYEATLITLERSDAQVAKMSSTG